jgi:hypothetical protein
MVLERRRKAASRIQAASRGAVDDAAEALFPHLFAFVTAEHWPDDGAVRVTGTVLIFADAGCFKMMLRDRDDPGVAFVTGGSLEAVLAAAEAGLECGGLDWRADRSAGPARKPGR